MKKTAALLVALLLAGLTVLPVFSSGGLSGKSYVYDDDTHNPTPIPDPYEVTAVSGSDLGLKTPEDLTVFEEKLYILDSTDPRVVVADEALKKVEELRLVQKDGKPYPFKEPKGIYIDPQTKLFYLAERSNHAVLVCSLVAKTTDEPAHLVLEKTLGRPDSPLMSKNTDYLPTSVITDELGVIYVRAENEYRGLVTMDSNGKFLGYFGSNNVTLNAASIYTLFWRKFMTEAQIARTQQQLPMEYAALTIDDNGFVFGARGTTSDMKELIRKINAKGKNVLNHQGQFGDYHLASVRGENKETNFNSICVDKEGFITVLDSTWNRLFQYNSKGNLMYIWGGVGEQAGTYRTPVDVECRGEQLLVLDRSFANITVLSPTAFGQNVRLGESLYAKGEYEASKKPWNDVLTACMNYQVAYVGMGKVLYMEKDYAGAMRSFRMGNNWTEYSTAFKMYRSQVASTLFLPAMILLGLASTCALVLLILRKKGIRVVKRQAIDPTGKVRYLFYTMFHPIEGFQEMRWNGRYNLPIALVLLFCFFFSNMLSALYGGFIFNGISAQTYNVAITLCMTIGVLLLFVLCNWLMATFLDGKGKLREVFIYLCYATLPYTIFVLIWTVLSNLLVADEGVFLGYFWTIGQIWTCVMIFFAIKGLHMYTVKRTLVSVGMTVLGMLIVLFLIFLMFNLFVQFFAFGESVITEVLYRIASGS